MRRGSICSFIWTTSVSKAITLSESSVIGGDCMIFSICCLRFCTSWRRANISEFSFSKTGRWIGLVWVTLLRSSNFPASLIGILLSYADLIKFCLFANSRQAKVPAAWSDLWHVGHLGAFVQSGVRGVAGSSTCRLGYFYRCLIALFVWCWSDQHFRH